MLTDKSLAWLKEHLMFLAVTGADKESAEEIYETMKYLFKVLEMAKKIVRPKSQYATNSRIGQLKGLLDPVDPKDTHGPN